jgi:hypothetical protein
LSVRRRTRNQAGTRNRNKKNDNSGIALRAD